MFAGGDDSDGGARATVHPPPIRLPLWLLEGVRYLNLGDGGKQLPRAGENA